jgi:hypothetical protein
MDSSSPPENGGDELAEVIQLPQRKTPPPTQVGKIEVYYTVREQFPVIDIHSHARTNQIDGTVILPKELVMRFVTIRAQYDAVHREVKSWINSSRSERGRTPL